MRQLIRQRSRNRSAVRAGRARTGQCPGPTGQFKDPPLAGGVVAPRHRTTCAALADDTHRVPSETQNLQLLAH